MARTLLITAAIFVLSVIALAAAKHAVYMSQSAELEEMLRYETEVQLRCFESEDGREGIRAFLEKRPPRFTGN